MSANVFKLSGVTSPKPSSRKRSGEESLCPLNDASMVLLRVWNRGGDAGVVGVRQGGRLRGSRLLVRGKFDGEEPSVEGVRIGHQLVWEVGEEALCGRVEGYRHGRRGTKFEFLRW